MEQCYENKCTDIQTHATKHKQKRGASAMVFVHRVRTRTVSAWQQREVIIISVKQCTTFPAAPRQELSKSANVLPLLFTASLMLLINLAFAWSTRRSCTVWAPMKQAAW